MEKGLKRWFTIFIVILVIMVALLIFMGYILYRTGLKLEKNSRELKNIDLVVDSLETKHSELFVQFDSTRIKVDGLTHSLKFPDTLKFCGEIIPQTWEVRERFLNEYYHIVKDRQRVYLWFIRAPRYFPYIESVLRGMGLPEDLKYIAMVESDLNELAQSRSGARGIWQFMRPTARKYGLRVDSGRRPQIDQRKDVEKSTQAAGRYFIDLYEILGTWSLAASGYNGGENKIEKKLKEQEVDNFWDIYFPRTETARFPVRAMVAKMIRENPERHGFFLEEHEYLQPIPADTVEVKIKRKIALIEVAKACSTTYREIRIRNRMFEGDHIPRGTYRLRIPQGTKELFIQNFKGGQIIETPSR